MTSLRPHPGSGAGPERVASEAPPGSKQALARGRSWDTVLFAVTALALLLLGAVLGVIGGFLNRSVAQVAGVGVPVGPVLAVLGNLAAGGLGGSGTGSRLGAALPGVGWLAVVVLFGTLRPEGDLVVTGDGYGLAFILSGALAAGVAATVRPTSWPNRYRSTGNVSEVPSDLR